MKDTTAAPGSRTATAGAVSHVEIRGPDYKGSLRGGRKTLFRYSPTRVRAHRLVIAEAPIDALSLAVLEECRPHTLYVGTGGGMGPGTIEALQAIIAGSPEIRMPSLPAPLTRMSPVTATPNTTPSSPTRRVCGSSGCGRRTISIGTTY